MPDQVAIRVDQYVPVRMRDGTTLYADVYRPDGSGQYPTLLSRTPYDKNDIMGTSVYPDFAIRAAREGYAVVVQDTRGRFSSEGDFYAFKNEIDDGYDTVEWTAAQPWSTGKVGMFGGSYVGATQWLAAMSKPPHLTAIAPSITASEYYEGWTYQGGAFQLFFNLSWAVTNLTLPNWDKLSSSVSGLTQEHLDGLVEATDNLDASLKHLPLENYPVLKQPGMAPYYYDWLAHPGDDAYWKQWRIEDHHPNITTPAFNIGGWYDIFLGGTIRNFQSMREKGATEDARRGQKLILGPWFHDYFLGNIVGDSDFGVMAAGQSIELTSMLLRWYDYWLKGEQNGIIDESPVRIFVMGANCWRDENEWPLARTRYVKYYLHSEGNANTLNGDGCLSPDAPADEPADVFLYNPHNPVPTKGGGLCCYEAAVAPGAFDHREIESRPDVLVYSTQVLERDVEVTGPIIVTLWAASSAVDTDFTGKLLDVCPCGGVINLTDGIIRARYRESTEKAKLIKPDEVYEYTIDLWATSNVFKAGHRIRLEVSSSNFPRFDRNPNTGATISEEMALKPAVQTILHNNQHPSHVTLPIIPG